MTAIVPERLTLPSVVSADKKLLQQTMLAVCLEVGVSENDDGSGTGCWFLDDQAIARIRERHGNFSYAERGGTAACYYWSSRLVGQPGTSPFYLIHHISTAATGINTEYLTSALDVSHLCGNTRCWNPHHLVSEDRESNLLRRSCPGDIVDGEGSVVHNCLCRQTKCIGTQNVRLQSVIDIENHTTGYSIKTRAEAMYFRLDDGT